VVDNAQPHSVAAHLSYPSLRHHAEQFGVLIEAIALRIVETDAIFLRR
jgi:hypothetical protein